MPSRSERIAELERSTPLAQRLTVKYPEAAVLTGLPVTALQEMVSDGTLSSIKVGRARLIHTKSLIALLEGRITRRPPVRKGGRS